MIKVVSLQVYHKLWSSVPTPVHVSRLDAFTTVQQALGKAICRSALSIAHVYYQPDICTYLCMYRSVSVTLYRIEVCALQYAKSRMQSVANSHSSQ